jgi:succinoglycan biosynthesis protein ExoW
VVAQFAVVIPFFQRNPGILRNAVEAIKAQQIKTLTIIADDSSPVPAEQEIANPNDSTILIIKRPNGGPAAARNTCLNNIPPDIPYVAFLDSDDVWEPDHLTRALSAFSRGATTYSANWLPLESPDRDAYTFFNKINLADHQAKGDDLYIYKGDLVAQEITNPIFRLSTVCYSLRHYHSLRFDEGDRYFTAEDRILSVKLALHNPQHWFSSRIETRSGEGVNIFSSIKYASVEAIRHNRRQKAAMREIMRNLRTEDHKKMARVRLSQVGRDYIANVLGLIRRSPRRGIQEIITRPWR